MSQFIFAFLFFILGYFMNKHLTNEKQKKYIYSVAHLQEIMFFAVLKEYIEMHNFGLEALRLTLEKCSEDCPDLEEDYKKIHDIYEKKFNQFGEQYYSNMKNIFPFDLKYKSYKEVKQTSTNLFIK